MRLPRGSRPSRPARAGAALVGLLALTAAAPGPSTAQVPSGAPREPEVVLVTGSTGGLGREVARILASRGAHVIVHGRSEERGLSLVAEIEAQGVGSARFYQADLASFAEVRRLADEIGRDYDHLDALVNNAGIALTGGRRVSADGHELHFQVNYLSGFLLTRLLMPLLEAGAPSRIVNVSSISRSPVDFDDPMIEEGYSLGRAYGQSKLAQVSFTFELAHRLEGTGVTVNALHPSTMMDTDMVRELGVEPRSTVEEGAAAVVHLVTAPDLGSGVYFDRTTPARAGEQAYDQEARDRLWRLSEELTGVTWR